jgi:hypothetical protein
VTRLNDAACVAMLPWQCQLTRSTDGGSTWIDSPITNIPLWGLAFDTDGEFGTRQTMTVYNWS